MVAERPDSVPSDVAAESAASLAAQEVDRDKVSSEPDRHDDSSGHDAFGPIDVSFDRPLGWFRNDQTRDRGSERQERRSVHSRRMSGRFCVNGASGLDRCPA